MSSDALFGLSVLMSFIAFSIVTKLYIWPRLPGMRREDALVPLVVPHTFRFVGLSFLIPGVVSPALSSAFAIPAAYGDLVAAVLAVIAKSLADSFPIAAPRANAGSRTSPCSPTLAERRRAWLQPRIVHVTIVHWTP